jgi:hypothetical protein
MSSERIHDKLIAEAATSALRPLGFQRKGRSRLWFRDQDWWLAIVDFQPSTWTRAAYLNVAAKWLWRGDDVWSFDFSFHPGARAAECVEFETESQFRDAIVALVHLGGAEARRLIDAFPSIQRVADHLKARATARGDGWPLYDAGVAAFLAGRPEEARGYFTELGVPRPDDHAGALWLHELRAAARTCAGRCADSDGFRRELAEQLHKSRAALRLPAGRTGLPAPSLYAV